MNKLSETLSAGEDATETLSLASADRLDRQAAGPLAFYPGELVAGRFSIVGSIGRGGMGEVYEAVDQELGQRVAVKTLRPGSASSEARRERFRQEILLARQVTHPNVCRIFDLCHHSPRGLIQERLPLLSMELLSGETLAARLRRDGPLGQDEALGLLLQMVRGLAAAHQAGVVHCDLKSSNVMLVPQQDETRVVVMDFGLASTSSVESLVGESRSGGSGSRAGGTPAYMAPEVLRGDPATPSSDVYSLGVVIFEMLTGERPGKALETGPALDPFWRVILARCLDGDPDHRYTCASELLESLTDGGEGSRRFFVALATGAVLMLVVALAVYLGLSRSSPPPSSARPALAILKLHNTGPASGVEWISVVLPEMLGSRLAASGEMRWVGRDTLSQMGLDDVGGTGEGLATRELAEIRRATGADYVLVGGYKGHATEGGLEIALALHDTRLKEVTLSLVRRGDSFNLTPLITSLAEELHAHLSLPSLDGEGASLTRPPSPAAAQLYAEGLEELDAFRFPTAVARLESALKADGSFLLARVDLIRAYLELGELARASVEIQEALSFQGRLPRELHLTLEALAAEAMQDWEAAYSTWDALWTFYPDEIEYGLGVVRGLLESSRGAEAVAAVQRLRESVPHLDGDPRIDLAEARAAGQAGRLEDQLAVAREAEKKALRFKSTVLQARSRLQVSIALRSTRSIDDALEEAMRARVLFEQSGHRPGVAEALLEESTCLRHQREREQAIQRAVSARRIYQALGHRRGVADARQKQAGILLVQKPNEARVLYEQARETYEAIGNQNKMAAVLHDIGLSYLQEADYQKAHGYYLQALVLFRQIGDPAGESLALNSLGFYHYHAEREVDTALAELHQSLEIKRRINDRLTSITTLVNLSNIYLRKGPLREAERHLEEAWKLTLELDRSSRHAIVLRGLAQVRLYQDRAEEAESLVRDAIEKRRAKGSHEHRELWVLARIHLEQNRLMETQKIARDLMLSPRAIGQERGKLLQAEVLTREGRLDEASAVFEKLRIELADEDWTDLLIRSRRIQVRHLQLRGHRRQALELNNSIEQLAERNFFGFLRQEIKITGCGLEEEPEVAQFCWSQARRNVESLGSDVLMRRIREAELSDQKNIL